MQMTDVLSKLKEIAENYDSEDVQRAITAAEMQVHENQDDLEEGGSGDTPINKMTRQEMCDYLSIYPSEAMDYSDDELRDACMDLAQEKANEAVEGGSGDVVEEDAVEEVHEDVEDDHSLEDILKLAGQSGVMGMNQNNLLSESVYHELDEDDLEEARYETDEVKAIIAKHLGTARPLTDNDMDNSELYQDLYDYFVSSGDMPYGTAKARDGDPDEWIFNRLDQLGMVESAEMSEEGGSGDAPEYADIDADDKRWDDAEEEEEGDIDMEETIEVPVTALQDLMRLAGYEDYESKINEYENDPEEEYYDTEDQMIGLSGGLNGPKKMYPQAHDGDNPMAMRALKTDDVNEEYTFESVYKRYQDFINKDSE